MELRHWLDRHGRSEVKKYVPHRRQGEKLQVVAVVNFKGGSGKTTTAAHLAQYFALTGHRVLAIDLDPQASLSALHGFSARNQTGIHRCMKPYGTIAIGNL